MNTKSFRRVIWLLIPAILALTSACIVTEFFQDLAATPTSVPSTPTITSTLTSTLTPTDTPIPPTITLTTTSTPVPTISPTITQTPTQELPHARYPQTPVPVQLPLPYVEGQWRILLVGVDNRVPNSPRADSIILLTLNPNQETATLLSIPPELYVNIPEVGMQRINSTLNFGGVGRILDTIQYNLGVRADRYLAVDFMNFLTIVDTIGTINVEVGAQLIDRCDLPQAVNGWCTVQPGIHEMDENTALWYVRDRAGGEFERMRRSQEVLVAIFKQLMYLRSPAHIPELFDAYSGSVETDLTPEDLSNLSTVAVTVYSNKRITRYAFSPVESVPTTLPGGEFVLLLDQKAAWNLIQRAVFHP